MRKAGSHNFPAIDRVIYGKAASEAVKEEAEQLNATRVFLIISRTLNTKTDEIEKIRRMLGDKHAATFDGIAPHTTRKQAAEVALHAKEAQADLVVAVGGGSAVDLAKIVIMAMEHDIGDEAGFDPFPMVPGVSHSPFRSPAGHARGDEDGRQSRHCRRASPRSRDDQIAASAIYPWQDGTPGERPAPFRPRTDVRQEPREANGIAGLTGSARPTSKVI